MKATLLRGVRKESDGFSMVWTLGLIVVLSLIMSAFVCFAGTRRNSVVKQSEIFYRNLERQNKDVESEWIYAAE